MSNAKPGDTIKITTKDGEYIGILMPHPDLLGLDIKVIKLKSGYNIGIFQQHIKSIEVIDPHKPIKEEKHTLPKTPKLPNISILSLGGTISSKLDYSTGGVYADYTAEDFVVMCPELSTIANLKAKKVLSLMSEDMTPENWQAVAKIIADEVNGECDGVVITQGTDTLHFTTAAMSFMLSHLHKPVIFTASQRSIDRGSTDAFMNLICSVKAAAQCDGAVVATCMHASPDDEYCILIRGTKVRKMHTSRRDAFRPINEKELAKVSIDKKIEVINTNYPKGDKKGKTVLKNSFEPKTALIQVYPGMDPDIIDFYINKGYKGIVLSATGLGHIPTNVEKFSLMKGLQHAQEKNIPVVIASQTLYGRTNPYVYTNLRKLSLGAHCLFADDMLPEVAYVKLGWVLGQEKDINKVKQLFEKNVAGECNPCHQVDEFLR